MCLVSHMTKKTTKPKQKCEVCGKVIKGYPAYFACKLLCTKCMNQAKYKATHPFAIKSFMDKYIR